MSEVTFKSENGHCPYFIYKKIKFFIRDEKQENRYKYSLCSKDLQITKSKFDNEEDYKKYLESKKAIMKSRHQNLEFWENKRNVFKVLKHSEESIEIQQTNLAGYESGWFDNYIDCLNFSKEYILKIISKKEVEHLNYVDVIGGLEYEYFELKQEEENKTMNIFNFSNIRRI